MTNRTENSNGDYADDEENEVDAWMIEKAEKLRNGAEIKTRFAGIEVYTGWEDEDGCWVTEDTGVGASELAVDLRDALNEHFNRVIFIMEEEGLLDRKDHLTRG